MRLPLSRPLLYAFYALFSCAWLQGAALTQASVTNKELVVVGAIEQQQPDAEPPKNLLLSLPEDLYLVIGPFLSDGQLARMLAAWAKFKKLQRFFRRVSWNACYFEPPLATIESWAHQVAERKTLYIHPSPVREGHYAWVVAYVVARLAVQKNLTGLVLKAPAEVAKDLDFLLGFAQLTALELELSNLLPEQCLPTIAQCPHLKTLILSSLQGYTGNFEGLGDLTGLETLKFSFKNGCKGFSALARLKLHVLWLSFQLRIDDQGINESLAFLGRCTQLKELNIRGVVFPEEQAAKDFCKRFASLIHLEVLELRNIGFYGHAVNMYMYGKRFDMRTAWIKWSAFKALQALHLKGWIFSQAEHVEEGAEEELTGLEAISGCAASLRRLECVDCKLLTQNSAIDHFPHLEFLNLVESPFPAWLL